MKEIPTPETDAAVIASNGQWSFILKETCQKLERERDEALSQIVQAECRAERFCQERDEARTTIEDAKRALCAIGYEGLLLTAMRVKEELDEARNAIVGLENKWKCAIEMAARAELERDYALDKLNDLKNILR